MSAKNTSITLSKPFIDFAQRKIKSGEFASTSEVVREAMRKYIAYDDQVERLRLEIQKGLDSGPARSFDWDAFMEQKFGSENDA